MQWIANSIQLFVRLLSKQITLIDLNKLSFWKNGWKLSFNVEKCKELQIEYN